MESEVSKWEAIMQPLLWDCEAVLSNGVINKTKYLTGSHSHWVSLPFQRPNQLIPIHYDPDASLG